MLWLILSIFKKKCHYKLIGKNSIDFCLVLLCDQNSFGQSKMVLVWPNWFELDHNDLVTTKMKWSGPKWIGQDQMWFILVENHNLYLTNSFWSRPNHYGQVEINSVKPKPFWTDQYHFGHIEGQGISSKELEIFMKQSKIKRSIY